jgi:hypothetical protein
MLQKETKYGLTFGQILSLLAVFGGILTVWVSLNVRIAQAEVRIESLENGYRETIKTVETVRSENREDHRELMKKLDELMKIKEDKK